MALDVVAEGVAIRLCGDAALLGVDGCVVPIGRKALALLGYLAIERGLHSRRHLAAMLWPDADDARAATSLRQALSKLRELLGAHVGGDRHAVQFVSSGDTGVQCDVQTFLATVGSDPSSACRIDVHRYLESCRFDDAPEFAHWLDRTRAELTRKATEAISRVAREHAARRDWAVVARAAERWLQFDALSEDAACLAIEAAYMRRDVGTALRLQREFEREWGDQLNRSSSERMNSLRQRFESLAQATPVRGVAAVRATTVAEAPTPSVCLALRERDVAWNAITGAVSSVRNHGRAERLVIQGDAGTGRSRLLHDVAAWAAGLDVTVLVGSAALQSGVLPYSMLASLVRQLADVPSLAGVDERHLKVLVELSPSVERRFPSLRRSGSRDDATSERFAWSLQLALQQAVEAIAEDGPVILLIDDADFCDGESGRILQLLLASLDEYPILWLFAGATPFSRAGGHPFWGDLERNATVIQLTPLSATSIEEMLSETSGECDGWLPLVNRLHAATHGAPAYVCAAIDQLSARCGTDWQSWRSSEPSVPPLAPRQRERIGELDDMSEAILLSLAIIVEEGHPVPLAGWIERPAATIDQLSRIHGISRLRATLLGERLVAARVAIEVPEGFRCASPVVAEHLLTRASPLLLAELRAAIRHVTTSAG